jgi:hypothetical protein
MWGSVSSEGVMRIKKNIQAKEKNPIFHFQIGILIFQKIKIYSCLISFCCMHYLKITS